MKITWSKRLGQYQSGDDCYAGKIRVGSASYYGGSKTDPEGSPKYKGYCELPGMADLAERFATIELAKARVEKRVRAWFAATETELADVEVPK